ncbi:MAG: THUMP domain-containing class I SAM-dependent RNA methyltransferase [Desulfovibrio sp.]
MSNIFNHERPILVTCPKGMPPFLAQELTALGCDRIQELAAGVSTAGTLQDCMRLNLHLRIGHRVLFELDSFRVNTPEELYKTIKNFPWEEFIPSDGYVSIASSVDNGRIRDSRYANLKVKDAIVDRFMDKFGHRPDSGPLKQGVQIFLYWQDDYAAIYIDTSGSPLPKRGYRKMPHKAPMQETLVAACLRAAEYTGGGNIITPMCGSGTFAIEAALIACNRAPGLLRSSFGFQEILGFNTQEEYWQKLRKEASSQSVKNFRGKIIATDHDPEAITAAKQNALTAGVDHLIEFSVCDFAETEIPASIEGEKNLVILNPEYGERLGESEQLAETYKSIGDFFKQSCGGYMGYIFTGNMKLAKRVGLRTSRRVPFYNAKIECRLLQYELYSGSKKASRQNS